MRYRMPSTEICAASSNPLLVRGRFRGERRKAREQRVPVRGLGEPRTDGLSATWGRISEAAIADGAFVRIDVPHPNAIRMFRASQFYSPSAVYAITPTMEEVACAIGRRPPEPVSRWELPALPGQASGCAETDGADEVDDEPP